jgi:hypothetical protein
MQQHTETPMRHPQKNPSCWPDVEPISFQNSKKTVTSQSQALVIAKKIREILLECKVMTDEQRRTISLVTFGFGDFVRALAKYHQKGNRVRFSNNLFRPGAPVKLCDFINTVKHELAHAAVGVKERHNNTWKEFFIGCGGNGAVCGSMQKVDAPYSLQCVELKRNPQKCFVASRFVLPMKNVMVRKCCRNCRGKLEVLSTKTGEVVEMK